jgi:hypothetical protein
MLRCWGLNSFWAVLEPLVDSCEQRNWTAYLRNYSFFTKDIVSWTSFSLTGVRSADHYRDFLSHDLPNLLEGVPVYGTCMMVLCAVRDVLSNTCRDECVGTGGPTARPPCSSDLNPLYLYLWGHTKLLCMQLLLTTKRRFTIAVWMPVRLSATAPPSVNGCDGPWWNVPRRALNLMEDILSTYYKSTLSDVTHKLNVSGHKLIWTILLVWIRETRVRRFSANFNYNQYVQDLFRPRHCRAGHATYYRVWSLRAIKSLQEYYYSSPTRRYSDLYPSAKGLCIFSARKYASWQECSLSVF